MILGIMPAMQINLDYNTGAYSIRSYSEGEIVLNTPSVTSLELLDRFRDDIGDKHEQIKSLRIRENVIITPKTLETDFLPKSADEMMAEHFEKLVSFEPEIIILGTGAHMRFPSPEKTRLLVERGIGLEVMGTAAACRTYNFLIVDGRKIAAALFMI